MSEFSIEAKPENLTAVIDFVTEKLEAVNCPIKAQTQIFIAVEEIFVNIAHYAYKPEIGGVNIRVSVGDDVVIEFEDKGRKYNPLEKEDPDITKSVDEREVGGLGVFMVKNIMDAVEYRYEDRKNILVIRKRLV